MWETIWDFLVKNSSSIIASAIAGAIFFVLGPLGLWFSGKKVKREKISKAKAELTDLFEGMLVNKEATDIKKLLILFHSVERNNNINLGNQEDLNNILEDLILRFTRSKHLASEQKDEYIKQITSIIANINYKEKEQSVKEPERREIPKSYKTILGNLRKDASELKSESILENVELLEKKLIEVTDPFVLITRRIKENPNFIIRMILGYVILMIIITVILTYLK